MFSDASIIKPTLSQLLDGKLKASNAELFVVIQGWNYTNIIIYVDSFIICLVGDWQDAICVYFILVLEEQGIDAGLWGVCCI